MTDSTGRELRKQRTSADYAIEHAEYLAAAAERLLDSINAMYAAREEYEDADDDEVQAAGEGITLADESVSERMGAVRDMIYEFRKRAKRATSPASETTTQMEQLHSETLRLNQHVSDILCVALSGRDAGRYHTAGGYVRWGLVEQDIQTAISAFALEQLAPALAVNHAGSMARRNRRCHEREPR